MGFRKAALEPVFLLYALLPSRSGNVCKCLPAWFPAISGASHIRYLGASKTCAAMVSPGQQNQPFALFFGSTGSSMIGVEPPAGEVFDRVGVRALLQTEGDVPLVVNLDGTLLKSDSLLETFFHLLATDLRAIAGLPSWLVGGSTRVKYELAARTKFDAELLPYDGAVIDYLRNKRANGRSLVLVSSAGQPIVDLVAKHLGLFEEAHGSTRDVDLSGEARARFLVKRFGEGRFDYVGEHSSDRPIWTKARRIITVNASASRRSRLNNCFPDAEHVAPAHETRWQRLKSYIAALRPDQWVKNLLVFVPMVADHRFDAVTVFASLTAFVAFSLTASSVYILNDLVDLSHDRSHPWKHARPFASGRVPVLYGVVMMFALVAAALSVSVGFLNLPFLAALGIYYLLTLLYSLKLKRVLVVDMMTLAGLYTIRVMAGAAATGISPSEWLLALSMFMFLALAAVKRQSELMDLAKRERSRAPGRRYLVSDLPMIRNFGTSAGYISVLVLALYISSPEVGLLYRHPQLLWCACPLLLYWVSRMLMMAHRAEIRGDPIVFACRDRASLLTAVAMGAVVAAAAAPWP